MTTPATFLISLGQALSTMRLYQPGHPARERAVALSYEHLVDLLQRDPAPTFSFLERDIVYGTTPLHDMPPWDWGQRLAEVGIQRIELREGCTVEEYNAFLSEALDRLGGTVPPSAEARQLRRRSIEFGPLAIEGAEASTAAEALATAVLPFNLQEEIATVEWMHREVSDTGRLPLLEAEAVVRSLSLAMHAESGVLLPLLELKEFDQYTTTHSCNVAVLSMGLAESMELTRAEVRSLGLAGLLHDLGKTRIPHDILVKPGAFTESEREVMRRHPAEGAKIILGRERGLDLSAVVAYEHHIMLDGGGYPSFVFGRHTHPASQLVHVCDVYDALCTHRPYREAWQPERSLAYLEERAGSEFDPAVVGSFAGMIRGSASQRMMMDETQTGPEDSQPAT